MLGVGDYAWRLIPGNPILLRVVNAGGKRRRDLFIRCSYLGLLIFIVIFSLLASGTGSSTQSLADLSKTSASLFEHLSYVQLGLVALLSPVFTAGAITQERDSQTYDILLATPLTNGQVLFGSLLSRVFFVVALLISGVPVFSITQVFGGVAIRSIVLSFLIAASTAMLTGALAMAIAVFKVGTRRTIFAFYMVIVVYLIGGYMLDQFDFFHPFIDSGDPTKRSVSWFTGIHPFLALRTVFNDKTYLPPNVGDLPPNLKWWPLGWYFSDPSSFYIVFMFALSIFLVIPSTIFLRRLAQSTTTLKGALLQKLHLSSGDRGHKPRGVWNNPIAWREAKTKGSAMRASALRYAFIVVGLAGAIILLVMYNHEEPIKDYIGPDSYDANSSTLTVYSNVKSMPVIYRIRPLTQVTLDRLKEDQSGNEPLKVGLDALHDRYVVDNVTTQTDPATADQPNGITWASTISLSEVPRRMSLLNVRQWLLGLVILEFSVILLIVTNAAASTVTREKEDGTLDLLLSTPITSRYYIWGKLRGLVSFVLPFVAVPILGVLLFVLVDIFHRIVGSGSSPDGQYPWVVFPEGVLILPGTLILVTAFASILGMQMSLRCRTTVMAVMSSVGIVVGACFALGFCGRTVIGGHTMGATSVIFGSFSPFTLVTMLVNPLQYAPDAFGDPDNWMLVRITLFISGWVAVAVYALIVWAMYKSMVKNFDMTIRKQSR